MGFVNSFKDETKFLFSGKSMPYEKLSTPRRRATTICSLWARADSTGSVAKFVHENCPKPVIFAKGMPADWNAENNFRGGDAWKD